MQRERGLVSFSVNFPIKVSVCDRLEFAHHVVAQSHQVSKVCWRFGQSLETWDWAFAAEYETIRYTDLILLLLPYITCPPRVHLSSQKTPFNSRKYSTCHIAAKTSPLVSVCFTNVVKYSDEDCILTIFPMFLLVKHKIRSQSLWYRRAAVNLLQLQFSEQLWWSLIFREISCFNTIKYCMKFTGVSRCRASNVNLLCLPSVIVEGERYFAWQLTSVPRIHWRHSQKREFHKR